MANIDLASLRDELQRKIEAIDTILGRSLGGRILKRVAKIHNTRKSGRRKMSAAGRAKIAAAARARWAKARASGRNRL